MSVRRTDWAGFPDLLMAPGEPIKVIGDFQWVAERALTEEEIGFLGNIREIVRRRRSMYAVGLWVPPILILAVGLLGAIFWPQSDSVGVIWMLLCWLPWLVGIAVFIVKFPSETRLLRTINRDLAANLVEVYARVPTATGDADLERPILRTASGRLFSAEEGGGYHSPVRPNLVAPVPALSAAFPANVVGVDSEGTLFQRSLSVQELAEIDRFLNAKSGPGRILGALLVLLWLLVALVLAVVNPQALQSAPILIWGIVFALPILRTVHWQYRMTRLSADREAGVVLRRVVHGVRVEALSKSRLVWSIDSKPARWRKHMVS